MKVTKKKEKDRRQGRRLLKLYGLSLGLAALLILIGGLLFWLTDLSEGLYLPWMMLTLSAAAALFGFGSAQILGKRGVLTGLLTGGILMASLLAGVIFLLQPAEKIPLFQPLYCIPLLSGAAGGFWGVGRAK